MAYPPSPRFFSCMVLEDGFIRGLLKGSCGEKSGVGY